jgi:hypothetical protein
MEEPRAPLDIERVRFSGERDALHAMQRHHHDARVTFIPAHDETARRSLLAKSLLLSESMAPEAHQMARLAAERLGLSETIEMFQSHATFDSARVATTYPVGIEFLGAYLESLDAGGLLAVIGHEIGHCIAQRRMPAFAWALASAQSAQTKSQKLYSIAAEITADRFGVLACRDIGAVLRLEMRAAAGKGRIVLDTDAYLAQARALVADLGKSGAGTFSRTHPEHYVRAYAEWLFSESDVYASITGEGPGTRRLEDVDEELRALLRIPVESEPALESAAPSPSVAKVADAEQTREAASSAHDGLRRFRTDAGDRIARLFAPAKRAKPAESATPPAASSDTPDLVAQFAAHVREKRGASRRS